MWSQHWNNIYPLLKPADSAGSYDLTKVLVEYFAPLKTWLDQQNRQLGAGQK